MNVKTTEIERYVYMRTFHFYKPAFTLSHTIYEAREWPVAPTAKQTGLRATLVAQAVCTAVQPKRAQLHTSKAIMGYSATSKRSGLQTPRLVLILRVLCSGRTPRNFIEIHTRFGKSIVSIFRAGDILSKKRRRRTPRNLSLT
jgi:hypothetical protein